jgi:hypothetical protein
MSWITENRDVDSFVDTLIEWVNENTKKTRAKKAKSSEPEDPDRVKKPVPASWMYRTDKRDEIIKDHFDGESVKGSVIAKKAQELWNELSDEEKRPYEEKRQELWDEYQKYKGASGSPKAEKKKKEAFAFTTDEDCEVPEGWNGPHDGHLHKYVTGLGKKVGEGLFATLAEAIEAANECEECNGITLCKFGYTLREGNNLRKNPTKEPDQTSWVKGVVSEKKVKKVKKSSEKDEKKEKKVKKVKKSSEKKEEKESSEKKEEKESSEKESSEKESSEKESSEYDALTDDDDDDDDDISETEMKEQTEKAAEAASKILESDNEEDDDDEDDEDEEGGVEVVEWEFDGEDYLVDDESNVVYSVESQEEVGKRVKKGGSWKLVKA